MTLSDKQLAMCNASRWDFSDLKALFLNGFPAHGNQRSEWEAGCR